MLLELDESRRTVIWQGKSDSEIDTDGLHAVVNTPVIDGDYIYGFCSYGQFRCLRSKTGERVWESMDVLKEKARWASGFIVRNGDRYFINKDRGELIIAKLSPKGYHEIEPHPAHQADLQSGQPPRAGSGELVPPGLREPARLRAQRRRDRPLIAREIADTS